MNFVERCLYEYKANVASIEAMKDEINSLMSVHALGLDVISHSGVSSPVENITERKIRLEKKIKQTEKRTKPVERLQADLCGSDLRISQIRGVLKLRYIEHESKSKVLRELAISESTFWRRNRELLKIARKYFYE